MIERGRVGYLWNEDAQRAVYLIGHRTINEERCNGFSDVIPHYRLVAFVESDGEAIGS